ncbi:hypothetical protein AcW1_002735 [Taiwanofungus camphoratus]|nr:hypothetical protein AcW1_002735 [Antrodia cinnamomea]
MIARIFQGLSTVILLGLSQVMLSAPGAVFASPATKSTSGSMAARTSDASFCQCRTAYAGDLDLNTTGNCCVSLDGTPVDYGCLTPFEDTFIACCGANADAGGCYGY